MLCLVLCGTQLVYFFGCVLLCCHGCHVVMSWLMSNLIGCVFVSCSAHGWWFVLLAMCFVWAHGFCLSFLCTMCFHVNCLDSTHLVTWLLVNLPHLSSLVTLLICSLYNNLLVFAVLCQFILVCSPVVCLPCPALLAVLFFPLWGSFVLFLRSSRIIPLPQPWDSPPCKKINNLVEKKWRCLRKTFQDFSPYRWLQWWPMVWRSKLQYQCSFKWLYTISAEEYGSYLEKRSAIFFKKNTNLLCNHKCSSCTS